MKKRPAWRTGSIPVRSDTIHLIGQVPLHTHQQLRDYLAKSEALAVELSADDAHGFAIFAAVSGSDAALEKGQFEEAVAIARKIEQIKAQLAMKTAAEKGRKFPGGSRPGRQNALSKLIDRAFLVLVNKQTGLPGFRQVIDQLESCDEESILHDIHRADERITWFVNGKEKSTTFQSIQNHLTTTRRKYRKNKFPVSGKAGFSVVTVPK